MKKNVLRKDFIIEIKNNDKNVGMINSEIREIRGKETIMLVNFSALE